MISFRTLLALLLFLMASAGSWAAETPMSLICDIWPPYQIQEKTKIVGFSAKLVTEVLKRMNVPIMGITAYPWKRALTMMERGKADALFSANYDQARTAFAHYPKEPLISTPWVLWVKKNNGLSFKTLTDLKGKHVGIVRGYIYTPLFWDYIRQNAHPEMVTDDETNFKKLNIGRIDYTVAELGNGNHIVKSMNLNNIIPLKEKPIREDGLFIIFNKSRIKESFVNQFSDELKKIKQESFYNNLKKEWFIDSSTQQR